LIVSEKKNKAQKAAEACGMSVEEWTQARQQATSSRTRGRRPAGTAGADAKLATWGPVEDQMGLFADTAQGGAL
jgi:hypothetical protein